MGMYTELNIGVALSRETPQAILDVIAQMVAPTKKKDPDFRPAFEHPLFASGRWHWAFQCCSYYFDGQPSAHWHYDEIGEVWYLTARSNIKNYDREWESFLELIAPHLTSHGFIGTYRYEESDHPTLLYADGGEVLFRRVNPDA